MDNALRSQITAVVGAPGMAAGDVVQPADLIQLHAVLAACAVAGVRVAPVGAADSDGAGVLVDQGRLDTIHIDAPALLLRAGAACTWATVRGLAAARRLAVTALPTVRSERVGQSIGLGEIARRTVAGVDMLTPAGEVISAGGRTLKDVVGYDIAGLLLGSGDRLGMVVGVTLRLEPAAARTAEVAGLGPWRGDAGVDLAAAFAAGGPLTQATSPASD